MAVQQTNRCRARVRESYVDAVGGGDDTLFRVLISGDLFSRRLHDLRENQPAAQLWPVFQEPLDREQFLFEPFRVVDPIYSDAKDGVGRQLQPPPDGRTAVGDRANVCQS